MSSCTNLGFNTGGIVVINDSDIVLPLIIALLLGILFVVLNFFAANGKDTNEPNYTEDILKVFNHDVDFKITFNIFKNIYEQKPKLISYALWNKLAIKYYNREQKQWVLCHVGFRTLEDYKKYSKYLGEMESIKEQIKEYNKLKDFAKNIIIDELVGEDEESSEQN